MANRNNPFLRGGGFVPEPDEKLFGNIRVHARPAPAKMKPRKEPSEHEMGIPKKMSSESKITRSIASKIGWSKPRQKRSVVERSLGSKRGR